MKFMLTLFFLVLPTLSMSQDSDSDEAISASQRILQRKRDHRHELPSIRQGRQARQEEKEDGDLQVDSTETQARPSEIEKEEEKEDE